jgi:hypothetical protein
MSNLKSHDATAEHESCCAEDSLHSARAHQPADTSGREAIWSPRVYLLKRQPTTSGIMEIAHEHTGKIFTFQQIPTNMKEGPSTGAKAFAILTDQINAEISAENAALSKEISSLESISAYLSSVEIRVTSIVDGNVTRSIPISTGLGGAFLNGFGRSLDLKIPVKEEDEASVPLADFGGSWGRLMSLHVSNQCVGTFCCIVDPVVTEILGVGSLNIVLNDIGGKVSFYGRIDNLCVEVYERIKKEVGKVLSGDGRSSRELRMYISIMEEMHGSNATFTPGSIVVHPGRLMKFKGLELVSNTLLLQRCKLLQSEMDIASLRGILEDQKMRFLEAEFNLLRVEGVLGEKDDADESNNLKKLLDSIEHEMRSCDEEYVELMEFKEELSSQFANLVPDYTNYARTEVDELRDLVHTVSNNSDRSSLIRNHCLKLQKHTLFAMKNRISHIEIFYEQDNSDTVSEDNEVCVHTCLEAGSESFLGEGYIWSVTLPPMNINANKLDSFEVHMSGVSLTRNGRRNNFVFIGRRGVGAPTVTLLVNCCSSLSVRGYLEFESIESRDETLANESFNETAADLFNNRRPRTSLPEDCKFVPSALLFNRLVDGTLNILGLKDVST